MSSATVRKVAFIGNHTPRQCGIATFTADVCQAVASTGVETQVVAMNDSPEGYAYPDNVTFQIDQDDPKSYLRAAAFLNSQHLDLVCVQHEYGIFGGPAGAHILTLLRDLNAPIVTTLHTILQEPRAEQRQVLAELAQLSARLIVMSHRGKAMLEQVHGIDPSVVSVVFHGIPVAERLSPEPFLRKLGLEGKRLILTFGLMSPEKGIENMVQAMPGIIRNHPDAFYLVVGATHPHVRKTKGESYRQGLIALCEKLGVSEHVGLVDRFVTPEDLTEMLHAASIYVTPYLKEEQITSGTLSRAFGCGKAVVSTPYWHAEDLLSGGLGILVPFRDSQALGKEIDGLLSDSDRLESVQAQAFREGLRMVWPVIGLQYVNTFDEAVKSSRSVLPSFSRPRGKVDRPQSIHTQVDLRHLLTLTDDTGIIQHAVYCIPNRFEGYCTDDNARLAIVAAKMEQDPQNADLGITLQHTALAFLLHAFNRERGRMRNFMAFDRKWLEEVGSEDSHGRALWALGVLASSSSVSGIRAVSKDLFMTALPAAERLGSLRSYAFTILGLVNVLSEAYSREGIRMLENLAGRLNTQYVDHASDEWRWFEPQLTYDNARLAQALWTAGHLLGNEAMIAHGKEALVWLDQVQTDASGCFLPIGSNRFYHEGGVRDRYDQQPIEAAATVDAYNEAYRITGDLAWRQGARRAFGWFHGANTELLSLIDECTGGCKDGLKRRSVNHNQGAESTLAYIASALFISQMDIESAGDRGKTPFAKERP